MKKIKKKKKKELAIFRLKIPCPWIARAGPHRQTSYSAPWTPATLGKPIDCCLSNDPLNENYNRFQKFLDNSLYIIYIVYTKTPLPP